MPLQLRHHEYEVPASVIKNPILVEILSYAARAGRHELFKTPNELTRKSHLLVFTPLFERYLRALVAKPLRLVPRHSVVNAGGFSMFESDIDFSIVLASPIDESLVTQIKTHYALIRRLFPFVGELEIYADWEHELKTVVIEQGFEILSLISLLRKWTWQVSAFELAPTTYHRQKARASIGKLRERLGLRPQPLLPTPEDDEILRSRLESLFPDRAPAVTFADVYSHFLCWTIRTESPVKATSDSERFVLQLPADLGLAFLAVLPDAATGAVSLQSKIDGARDKTACRNSFLTCSVAEFLTTRSVMRTETRGEHFQLKEWNAFQLDNIRHYGDSALIQRIESGLSL